MASFQGAKANAGGTRGRPKCAVARESASCGVGPVEEVQRDRAARAPCARRRCARSRARRSSAARCRRRRCSRGARGTRAAACTPSGGGRRGTRRRWGRRSSGPCRCPPPAPRWGWSRRARRRPRSARRSRRSGRSAVAGEAPGDAPARRGGACVEAGGAPSPGVMAATRCWSRRRRCDEGEGRDARAAAGVQVDVRRR